MLGSGASWRRAVFVVSVAWLDLVFWDDDPVMEEPAETPSGDWSDRDQVAWYTRRIGKLDARPAGEAMLVDALPASPERVLDLGCGDGRLAALGLEARPSVHTVIATDRSEPMLLLARGRFDGNPRVTVMEHDLNHPIGLDNTFDVVVSGFAIHHVEQERKRTLFGEVRGLLRPKGSFSTWRWLARRRPAVTRSSWPPSGAPKTTARTAWLPSTTSSTGCKPPVSLRSTASGGGGASPSLSAKPEPHKQQGRVA
jgi:SAM-dependent methyltransferase